MTKDIYQHRRHNKNLLLAHIIFVTKYRKNLLTGAFREDVMKYIYVTCQKHHWYIKKMETDKNHIHILLQYNPTDCITSIVSVLKQCSTWEAWQHYSDFLRHHYWKERTLWSDGYFAASVGTVSASAIEHYIENQG